MDEVYDIRNKSVSRVLSYMGFIPYCVYDIYNILKNNLSELQVPPNIVDLVNGTTQERFRIVSDDDILKFIYNHGTQENDVTYVCKICKVSDFATSQRCYVMNVVNMVQLLNSNGMLNFITHHSNDNDNGQFTINVNIGISYYMSEYDKLINSLEKITDSVTLSKFVQLTGENQNMI